MTRMIARVTGSWTKGGKENLPQLALDYRQPGTSIVDATGQDGRRLLPEPNLCVWEVEADEAVIDAIEKDPNYKILWSEYVDDTELA